MEAVLVSGCTSGVGRATTELLVRRGYVVVGVGRNAEKLDSVAQWSKEVDGKFVGQALDIVEESEQNVFGVISQLCCKHNVSSLINVVGGVGVFGTFESLSLSDWLDTYNVNLFCHLAPTKAFIKVVRDRPVRKRTNIVFLSSMASAGKSKFNPHYGGSNAAINHLTKVLAEDLGHLGVRVNCVSPARLNDMTLRVDAQEIAVKTGKDFDSVVSSIIETAKTKSSIGELASPSDVANTIEFLIGPSGAMIAGEIINLGGA